MADRMAISFGDSNSGFQAGQISGGSFGVHLAPERPETPSKPSSFIPFCRDSLFVERKALLDQIHQACATPLSRAALVGLGGVGKSQLAIEYAYRMRDVFTHKKKEIWVFWVHAGTRARVEQGFKAIADAVKIRDRKQPNADILQLVYEWLCDERNGQWLMVLDSADDANVFCSVSQDGMQAASSGEKTNALSTYLPQSSNGSIIITSRDRDLAFRLTGHHSNIVDVGPMDRTDALTLLETKSGSHFDEARGMELVEALGHMPLAISQAAAYIQQRAPRTSVKKYLEAFRENEQKQLSLLNHDSGDLRRDPSASNSVITTWQISFEHIRSQRPTATELLSLMSFFDCQGIQDYLLRPSSQNENRNYEAYSDDESVNTSEASNSASEEDTFEEDIVVLRNYCLISTNETGDTFEMHGLVQLSTRKWLDMQKETEKFKMECISRLTQAFPPPYFSNWPICRKLFPHVEQAIHYHPEDKELQALENFGLILLYGGWYSTEQGGYATAERMLKKALTADKKVFGAKHIRTLRTMDLLAQVYLHQQRWEDAEELLVKIREIQEAVLEPDHPDMLRNMHNLAFAYNGQERWQEAESLLAQVVEGRKRMLGPEHPDTLASIDNLASAYNGQERWQEAESLLAQVVEGRKREAESLLAQVVEGRKRVLGPEHPNTLTGMASLALSWKGLGHIDEAIELMEQCAQARIRLLGHEHPRTQNLLLFLRDWRAEKSQTQESHSKPMVGNRMASMAAKFRKLGFRRRRHDDGAGPPSQA
ncbi:P-loop containing nucleoside triphosphate hydrolase protein [Xylaria acuta]|nr:P-loop containing nucleoside triphosphate hydrolase protein [Xylaria acuta]